MIGPRRKLIRMLLTRADGARDAGRHRLAAELYGEVLKLVPERVDLHVQRGHMLKDSGQFAAAEHHYRLAAAAGAEPADLALQLGHLYKVAGRIAEARQQYARAAEIRPEWPVPRREMAALDRDRHRHSPDQPADSGGDEGTAPHSSATDGAGGRSLRELETLVPALAPKRPAQMLVHERERIDVRRLGRREDGAWGVRRTLRGIEAVHGLVVSETPVVELAVRVNGIDFAHDGLRGGYPLPLATNGSEIRKYVFNSWVDFSPFAVGLHSLELRFVDVDGRTQSWSDEVVIAEPVPERCYPDSDFLIAPDPERGDSIERQIRRRPSQIRQADRRLFPNGVRRVLVLRTDQLGDLVASLPALRRLRALLPQAWIVGAATEANADLARTLTDLLDEVIVVAFPDVALEQRRTMPLDEQERLRDRLHAYGFDIAIDLARADVSRQLLRLSGAKFLLGVGGGDWPFLSADFVFNTHDRWTGHDMTPHSSKVLAMMEALGTILAPPAPVVRRDELSRASIHRYGLFDHDRYIVLHLGARIGFSRWPHYGALTRLLLRHTDLKVVAIGDDDARTHFAEGALDHPRFVLLDRRLPFDELDALLSFATVMVGNDSGPKHLAALRGTPVVTIFSARINWTEWAQEGVGVVVSRKVPCAGCAILHEPENCGKDFACIVDIRPQEVFDQVVRLASTPPHPDGSPAAA